MGTQSAGFSATSAHGLKHLVEGQLAALAPILGVSFEVAHPLLDALAGQALNGPFRVHGRRLSAINRDGIPFQWSVSLGSRPGGLRFITDCGVPGTTISARVQYTLATLANCAEWVPLSPGMEDLRKALKYLLPPLPDLDRTLMGLCVGVQMEQDGTARFKIYVNGEVGKTSERYQRFSDCLAAFHRYRSQRRLAQLSRLAGDRIAPAFVAVEIDSSGIGRLKLYFRLNDGTPQLCRLVAEAAECTYAEKSLDAIDKAFLVGTAYPRETVDVCVEFPRDDQEPAFKIDLRIEDFLQGDADADRRICQLAENFEIDCTDHRTMMKTVVADPKSRTNRAQIAFVGLACRRSVRQIDVYYHPCHGATKTVHGNNSF